MNSLAVENKTDTRHDTKRSKQKDKPEPPGLFFLNDKISNHFGDKRSINLVIQTKLTIGSPNDKYEQEADKTADMVMKMPEPVSVQKKNEEDDELQTKPLAGEITPLIQRQEEDEEEIQTKPWLQRKCIECEEEERTLQTKPFLQKKAAETGNSEANTVGSFESRLNSSGGGGMSLPGDTKNFMESRFGANFSSVRVHTDNNAVQMNKEINAQAFTHGSDIYFNSGKYNPDTNLGKHLLAHELTHVVQQSETLQKKEDDMIGNPILGLKRGDGLDWGTWDLRSNVKVLQLKLVEKTGRNIKVDGMFGPKTGQTLELFQSLNNITPQQVVDPQSAELLMDDEENIGTSIPSIIPVNFTFPLVDNIKVIKTTKGAFSGFPVVNGVDLNKPQKFNETKGKGRVMNVHQIAFHLKQGDPNEVGLSRQINRVASAAGHSHVKNGPDGPSAPTVIRNGANIVVSDAPGYFGPVGNAPPQGAFPVSYVAQFILFAFDQITRKVLACIRYVVAIFKDHFAEEDPLNIIGAEESEIGECKKTKVLGV